MTLVRDLRTAAGEKSAATTTALLTLRVGVALTPTTTADAGHRIAAVDAPGTVLLGRPALGASRTPPRHVIRDVITGRRDDEFTYSLWVTVRNVGSGPVEWFSCIEVSPLGHVARHIALDVRTDDGSWSSPLAMNAPQNPAFCAPAIVAVGTERRLLLRVRLSPLQRVGESPLSLGLTFDTTLVETERHPLRRRPRRSTRP